MKNIIKNSSLAVIIYLFQFIFAAETLKYPPNDHTNESVSIYETETIDLSLIHKYCASPAYIDLLKLDTLSLHTITYNQVFGYTYKKLLFDTYGSFKHISTRLSAGLISDIHGLTCLGGSTPSLDTNTLSIPVCSHIEFLQRLKSCTIHSKNITLNTGCNINHTTILGREKNGDPLVEQDLPDFFKKGRYKTLFLNNSSLVKGYVSIQGGTISHTTPFYRTRFFETWMLQKSILSRPLTHAESRSIEKMISALSLSEIKDLKTVQQIKNRISTFLITTAALKPSQARLISALELAKQLRATQPLLYTGFLSELTFSMLMRSEFYNATTVFRYDSINGNMIRKGTNTSQQTYRHDIEYQFFYGKKWASGIHTQLHAFRTLASSKSKVHFIKSKNPLTLDWNTLLETTWNVQVLFWIKSWLTVEAQCKLLPAWIFIPSDKPDTVSLQTTMHIEENLIFCLTTAYKFAQTRTNAPDDLFSIPRLRFNAFSIGIQALYTL